MKVHREPGGRQNPWSMHLLLLIGVISLCAHARVQAQIRVEKEGIHPSFSVATRPASPALHNLGFEGPQPFDVLHYRLDIALPMINSALSGKCTMTLRLSAPVDSLTLNEVGLALDSVSVDGVPKTVAVHSVSETFTIRLGGTRNMGEVLLVEMVYRRLQSYPRPSSRQGYYYFSVDSLAGLPANLGYTMSEPSDARFWMPCFDEPWEKATAEINITVPAGYVAASNGQLLGVLQNQSGARTWRWREDHQIATYLMCMTVSDFATPSIPYVRTSGDTIPIQYYVWNRGSFTDSAAAAAYLPTVRSMVSAFSRVYGEYPFDKYGMTAIIPFGFGGMEHQTLTTLNRYLFTDEQVVSHELAHQWWGDLVTCATWPDVWLNESFASYSEAVWKESVDGPQALRDYMKNTLEHFFFSSWSGAVYDPEGQGFNLFDDVVYGKGAWVLHTLRGVLGDSTFFRVLAAYRDRFAGKSATTLEFKAVVDSVAGGDMSWFFNEWIFGRGWPKYASRLSAAVDTSLLTVYQLQDSTWPTYKMPIHVRAYRGGSSMTYLVWDSLRVQQFKLAPGFSPDSVALDPDRWILKQIVRPPAGVTRTHAPTSFSLSQNYPNPFNPTTTIRFSVPSGRDVFGGADGQIPRQTEGGQASTTLGFVSLQVFDVLGREVATLVDEPKVPGEYTVSFDGGALSSGIYLYRLKAGGLSLSRKMLFVK